MSRAIAVEISTAAMGTTASTSERKIVGWLIGFNVESVMYAVIFKITEGGSWDDCWGAGLFLTFLIRAYVFFRKSKPQPGN